MSRASTTADLVSGHISEQAAAMINRPQRWVCAGCGGPAHPGHGWHCAICRWSAYQTGPEVEREATDG